MKITSRLAVLFFVFLFCVPSNAQKITVRVIDAETGKPVQAQDSYCPVGLWRYDPANERAKEPIALALTPDSCHPQGAEFGELKDLDGIQLFADGYVDCRKVKITPGVGPHYSVAEILSKGVVTPNHCNQRTISATPGTIVLFVRPPNWFERHFRE